MVYHEIMGNCAAMAKMMKIEGSVLFAAPLLSVSTSGNHFSTPKRGMFALCIRPLRGVNRARSHGRLCPKWGMRGLRDLHDPALG